MMKAIIFRPNVNWHGSVQINDYINKSRGRLFVFIFFIIGLVCGTFLYSFSPSILDTSFFNLCFSRISFSECGTFILSFVSEFFIIDLIVFLSGLTLFGIPVVITLSVFYGLSIGLMGSYSYINGSWQNILFYIFIFLPGIIINLMALTELSDSSIKFSYELIKGGLFNKISPPKFKDFFFKFAKCVMISLLASLLCMILYLI